MSQELAISLRVELDDAASIDELAQVTAELREELLELDVDAVEGVAGPEASPDAKGASDNVETLIVALSNSAVLVALVGVLRSWISRASGRKITIKSGKDEITVSGASAEDQERLIKSWLDQHTGP
jgi:hypothetical protein